MNVVLAVIAARVVGEDYSIICCTESVDSLSEFLAPEFVSSYGDSYSAFRKSRPRIRESVFAD